MDGATTQDEYTLRHQAIGRIQARRGLLYHAVIFALVNVALWAVWAFAGAEGEGWYPWPAWVTFFWGLGLVFQAWSVLGTGGVSEDTVRREMDRIRSEQGVTE